MDHHIKEYYCQSGDGSTRGHFHKVISLNENQNLSWKEIASIEPGLLKGWFELARLSNQDRIDFTRDFWLAKLPYHPRLNQFLSRFFADLDDIGVFLVQKKFDDPFEAHLVYSLKNDAGYFVGFLPATEKQITDLKLQFSDYILPEDYLAFLQVHNGFYKTTDITGITPSTQMYEGYLKFQSLLDAAGEVATTDNQPVNPKSLIPFYESFGMPFFQCFWSEWYPENEMGNVYYSGQTKTISNTKTKDSSESMAFTTFIDWLMFYMERIEQ